MIDFKCPFTYACSLSAAQKGSQHGGSVGLALHSNGNVAVIPEHATQLLIHCAILKECSLSSLALSATVLPRYLKALYCTGGCLLMDALVGRETSLRNFAG